MRVGCWDYAGIIIGKSLLQGQRDGTETNSRLAAAAAAVKKEKRKKEKTNKKEKKRKVRGFVWMKR